MRFPFRRSVGDDLRALFEHDRIDAQANHLGFSSLSPGEGSAEVRDASGNVVAQFGHAAAKAGFLIPNGSGWQTIQEHIESVRSTLAAAAAAAQSTANGAASAASAASSAASAAQSTANTARTEAAAADVKAQKALDGIVSGDPKPGQTLVRPKITDLPPGVSGSTYRIMLVDPATGNTAYMQPQ